MKQKLQNSVANKPLSLDASWLKIIDEQTAVIRIINLRIIGLLDYQSESDTVIITS